MFAPDATIRGFICTFAAYAEIPWDLDCRRKGLRWNTWRCFAYYTTIALAQIVHPAASIRVWFYWMLFAPTTRALLLLAAQIELSRRMPWQLLVVVAGTFAAINPPASVREVHYLVLIVINAWAGLTGILGGDDEHKPLRGMLVAMALLEVVYFSGGWAWETWWLFPLSQTLVKAGTWGGAWLHARLEKR